MRIIRFIPLFMSVSFKYTYLSLFNVYVYAVLHVYMPYMMFTMYNEAPLLVKNGLN